MFGSPPPPPPGFVLSNSGGKPKRDNKTPTPPPGFVLEASGDVQDGDTIGLVGRPNGRLFGYDAFESGQTGTRLSGAPVNLGDLSRNALLPYVRPSAPLIANGKQSYGRPVVTFGDDDPVIPLLRGGAGYAAPDFLDNDPERRGDYMEAERLGRLNRQGGFATQHERPEDFRKGGRWNRDLRPDEEMKFGDELPADAPDLYRLTNEQTAAYDAFIARNVGNKNFNKAAVDGWFKENGVPLASTPDENYYEAVRKGEGIGSVDYSTLDAAALGKLKELIAYSGLRPEVAQEYQDLLKRPGVDVPAVMNFAAQNGMTLSGDELRAYLDAKAKGEDKPIPLPLINPGDGALGAGARGVADPIGFLDEMGAVADTLGATDYRESIWNSDRSLGEVWDNNARQNRAIIRYDDLNHPYARAGGQIVSGIALPFGAGVRTAGGLAKVGAAEGAIYSFGDAEGGILDRLKAVPRGAVQGAAIGYAGGKIIDAAAPSIKAGFNRLMGDAPKALPAPQALPDNVPSPPPGFVVERADMAAEPLPSISSPRLVDRIDVTAPRPLLDGPTEAMMRAATADVRPGDVLPRLSNEVGSQEEAARIGEGLYEPVKAPRERDVLDTRYFPSQVDATRNLPRKGPLDLVSWVRAKGGLQDYSGELRAAGVENAARKMDHAQGEARLGPLVDDMRGKKIDRMAELAWEAGYFPDHYTQPTVSEFLDALGNTYRGVNRRFHPDDFEEIDAFEAARQQRHDVERAKDEGAPLVREVGVPATFDDIVSNTPPASAYDDAEAAALSKVGNVRVDLLETPQDISRALKVANDITGGFDAARRGRVSRAETEALASDLGMTADDLLARRKGQAFNAEEALAARRILAKSGSELVNMARRIQRAGDEPGSELLANFRRALVRHTAIQEQVSGATAEAGRALAQFKMAANSKDAPGRILEGLVAGGGGPKRLREAAEAIIDLEADPANLNRFIEKANKPRFSDKLVELMYSFRLSGPQTHAVNMLSNTMTSFGQLPEHAIAASVGAFRRAATRKAVEAVTFSEVGARAVGMLQGTKEGLREFARALRTGEPTDFVTKVEAQSQKAISGLKGEIIRTPMRLLTAEDELFKAIARRMELTGLAVRNAAKEGLKGQEAKDRAAELLVNPTDDMMLSALDYARYLTFQPPLGPLGSRVSGITNEMPIFKVILPFIRTPSNLIKFATERSPLAPLMRDWRADFKAGGAKRDLALARMMVGTGVGAYVSQLAAEGKITGGPPKDDSKRALMLADGWQPYSVKIGDKWVSYQRLDPFAMTFGTAADLATMGDNLTEAQRDNAALMLTLSIVNNLASKTWLTGISDTLEAISDPQRYGEGWIERTTGSLVIPAAAGQLSGVVDPTMRESDGMAEYLQSRTPGASQSLYPRRDVWGEPIRREGGIGPDIISPVRVSTPEGDPITAEALRVGASITAPNRKLNSGVELTAEQYDKYQATAGPLGRKWLGDLLATPDYKAMTDEDKADAIEGVMKAARKAAKGNVLGGAALPDARPVKGKRKARATTPLPPPGFVLQP